VFKSTNEATLQKKSIHFTISIIIAASKRAIRT
jgi:hypothetical protein